MTDKNSITVYIFLKDADRKNFIDTTLKKVAFDKEIGYAGYRNKKFLRYYWNWSIYSTEVKNKSVKYDEKVISQIIEECLNSTKNILKIRNLRIFIFPTFNKFTIEKLGGIAGYTPWHNTILIHIYPCKGWQNVLKSVFLHELAHTQTKEFYEENKAIYKQLIHEGLAEVFREYVLENSDARIIKNISEAKLKKIMHEIKDSLFKMDYQLYKDLFYNADKYPLWTGYAIGYKIVKNFLKHKRTNIKRLLDTPSKSILKYYGI